MYKAFISYSHAADDKFAPALQNALQKFAKPWYKKRNLEIFRDEASLSASPHLWGNITKALDQSEYLVYLASPASEKSRWVNKEIEYWLEHKSIDTVLIALTEGELLWNDEINNFLSPENNSLPPALDDKFDAEPFYIDLRQSKSEEDLSLDNPIFKKEVLKLAATLHGKEPKDLASEEVSEHRKMMQIKNGTISVLILLLIATIGAAWYANQQKQIAVEQRDLAQSNYLISEAKSLVETNPPLALRLAEQAMLKNDDKNIEKAAIKIYRENSFDEIHNLPNYKGFEDNVLSVEFSPNEDSILVGSWDTSDKGTVRILDLQGNLINKLNDDATGFSETAFPMQGKTNFADSSETEDQNNIPYGFTDVAFSADGKKILAGSSIGKVYLWSLDKNTMQVFKSHTDVITSVAFSPDGQTILTGSNDGRAILWNLKGGRLHIFNEKSVGVNAAIFSPDGQSILIGLSKSTALLLNLNGNKIQEFKGLRGAVTSVAFSPDGKTMLTGTEIPGEENGTIRLWDLKGNPIQKFKKHYGKIFAIAFSPDGKFIFIGSNKGINAPGSGHSSSIWDLKGNIIKEYNNLLRSVRSVSFTKDGKKILIGAGFPYFLDTPLPLKDFLKSGKVESLSPAQKKQYGIQ